MYAVVSDLDGTLLDHATYAFEEALPALDALRRRDWPVILCTSKTRREVEYWRARMDNRHPFVVENGGAVFIPADYFPFSIPGSVPVDGYAALPLGASYSELTSCLREAAQESHCPARGFHQMTVDEVSAQCGLSPEQAALAMAREYDEPFSIPPDHSPDGLLAAIERRGKRWTRGGRFYHVTGNNDKAAAVGRLLELYRRREPGIRTIGIGDGLNDAAFLNIVDIPILIRTAWLGSLQAAVPRGIPTGACGPKGWNEAVLRICHS